MAVTDSGLSGYGFSKEAKRNLVIAIMSIQFIAIGYLYKGTLALHAEIEQIKTAQADSATAMYNRLLNQVAMKMIPLQQDVANLHNTVISNDSLEKIKRIK